MYTCNPYVDRSTQHGCNSCGDRSDDFWSVSFYPLPSRLVRKRHRDRKQTAIYCRKCYDARPNLMVKINDQRRYFDTNPGQPTPICCLCNSELDLGESLYALLYATHWMDECSIDSHLLANFCGNCFESNRISLARSLT